MESIHNLNPFVISFRPDGTGDSKQSEAAIEVDQFPNKRVCKNSCSAFNTTTCKQQTRWSKQIREQYSNLTEKFHFGRMEKECIGFLHRHHSVSSSFRSSRPPPPYHLSGYVLLQVIWLHSGWTPKWMDAQWMDIQWIAISSD
jgi:hypothetical protein